MVYICTHFIMMIWVKSNICLSHHNKVLADLEKLVVDCSILLLLRSGADDHYSFPHDNCGVM